ncbi:MAG TPA: HAD-IB family hydrolase [Rhodospirillaceae bacterium]|nr:HAD-IB family hydrolase [Rhodospirillaceae bacterium]
MISLPFKSSPSDPFLDPAKPARRVIAFFDFDGTLAKGDSLWTFLVVAVGWLRCLYALFCGLLAYAVAPKNQDRRTIIKKILLEKTLKGRRIDDLAPAIERMRSWPHWLETMVTLREHANDGHHIVIATGSLDLYVAAMMDGAPYHAILSTEMEVEDGVLTGLMKGGNCVRQVKAERVADYLKNYGAVDESWAYGNAPHDLPMMELVTHNVVI